MNNGNPMTAEEIAKACGITDVEEVRGYLWQADIPNPVPPDKILRALSVVSQLHALFNPTTSRSHGTRQ